MVKDLTIVIKADSDNAITALKSIRTELEMLKSSAREIRDALKLRDSIAKSGAAIDDGVTKPIEKATKKVKEFSVQMGELRKMFDMSSSLGHSHVPEGYLKDMAKLVEKQRKSYGKSDTGATPEQLQELEAYHQDIFQLSRKYGIAQSQAIEANTKLIAAARQKEIDAYHKKSLSAINLLKKDAAEFGKHLQAANKTMTSSGVFDWITGGQSKVSAKTSAAAFVEAFAADDRSQFGSKMGRLQGLFGRTGAQGMNFVPEKILKAMNKLAATQQNFLLSQTEVDDAKLGELEDWYGKINQLTRDYGVKQSQAIDKNNELKAKAAKGDAEAEKKQKKEVLSDLDKETIRLQGMGKKMGKAFEVQPGMTREQIKLIHKEIKEWLNLQAKLNHEISKSKEAGKSPYITTLSSSQKYADGQMRSWSAGKSSQTHSEIVLSPSQMELLQKYMHTFDEATQKSIQSMIRHRNVATGFASDVASMMKLQLRWFAGATTLFTLGAAAVSATKAFIDFDKALKDIGAVTNQSSESLKVLENKIIAVSLTVPASATELAKLSKMLVQSGLSAQQAAGVLEDVAKVAAISGATLEQVGSAYATAIMAWGMTAKDSAKIGNVLAASLNYSRLSIEDLAVAYNYVASAASQFNLSFEETNATLAVFSNVGLRASTMATGFAQVLSRMVDPPEEFRLAIERSGRSYESFLKILESNSPNKFADMIAFLESANFSGITALKTLGEKAGRELAAALNVGSQEFYEMNKKISTTTQLSHGFETAMTSVSNMLARFKNHLLAVAINLGITLEPALTSIIKIMTAGAKIIYYLSEGVKEIGLKTIAWSTGLIIVIPLLLKVEKAIIGIGAAMAFVGGMNPWVKGILLALTAVSAMVATLGYTKTGGNFNEKQQNTSQELQALERQKKQKQIFDQTSESVKSLKQRTEEWVAITGRPVNLPITNQLILLTDKASMAYEKLSGVADKVREIASIQMDKYSRVTELQAKIAETEEKLNPGKKDGWLAEALLKAPPEDEAKALRIDLDKYKTELAWAKRDAEYENSERLVTIATKSYQIQEFEKSLSEARALINKGGLLSEVMSNAAKESSMTEADKIIQTYKFLSDNLKAKQKNFLSADAYLTETKKTGTPTQIEAAMKEAKDALIDFKAAELADLARSAGFANMSKELKGSVKSIGDELIKLQDEAAKAALEIETLLGVDTREQAIELDIVQKRHNLEERIRQAKEKTDPDGTEIAKLEKQAKAAGGIYNEILSSRKEEVKKSKELVKDLEAEVARLEVERGVKLHLLYLEKEREKIQRKLNKDLSDISVEERNLNALTQAGLISEQDALEKSLSLKERKRLVETQALRDELNHTVLIDKQNDLYDKIAEKEKERITRLELLAQKINLAQNALNKQKDVMQFLGMDTANLERTLQYSQMTNSLVGMEGVDGGAITKVLERIRLIGTGSQSLKDDFIGLWDVFMIGVGKASAGMANLQNLFEEAATSTVNNLKNSVSDFFFSLTSRSEIQGWIDQQTQEISNTSQEAQDRSTATYNNEIEHLTKVKEATTNAEERKKIEEQILSLYRERDSTLESIRNREQEQLKELQDSSGIWEYTKDAFDKFLVSISDSIARTISDMYAKMLVGKFLEWFTQLASSKDVINAQNAAAIGTQASLIGMLYAEVGAVSSLTAAYYALTLAKAMAGMGGMGSSGPAIGTGNVGTGGMSLASGGTQAGLGESIFGNFQTNTLLPHTGGVIPKFHIGGKVAPDERLALLQTGEYVISRRGVNAIGTKALDAINSGEARIGGGGGTQASQGVVNNYYNINAVDPKSFNDYVKTYGAGAIKEVITKDLKTAGPTRTAIRGYA